MKHLTKKLLVIFTILFSLISLTSALATPTHAKEVVGDDPKDAVVVPPTGSTDPTAPASSSNCRDLLGMPSWDCNVDLDNIDNTDNLTGAIWQIVFNVLTDISVIAVYLVIGYVIYGGYLYMFSSGDPAKAMTGKKTLTRAFIGLAIVMLASTIVNTIRITLGADFVNNNCVEQACVNVNDVDTMVRGLIDWFIGVSSIVAVIFIVVGGVGFMTSRGDAGKLQKAKSTIIYALVGLIIVALARLITTFVFNIIDNNSDSPVVGLVIDSPDSPQISKL